MRNWPAAAIPGGHDEPLVGLAQTMVDDDHRPGDRDVEPWAGFAQIQAAYHSDDSDCCVGPLFQPVDFPGALGAYLSRRWLHRVVADDR